MIENNDYNDIMHLPRHRSAKHRPMSVHDRAAQFSSFAALTGYEEAIAETGRLTDTKIELTECQKQWIDEKLNLLKMAENPTISIVYFLKDVEKDGGAYITITGVVKRIDEYSKTLVLSDGTFIPVEDIYTLEGDMFKYLESECDYIED